MRLNNKLRITTPMLENEAPTLSPTIPRATMRNPERIAWGVLLIAFAVFCTTCVLSVLASYAFFFQSTVPMRVIAQPTRNTFGHTGADRRETLVRDRPEDMNFGNIVAPSDPQSQLTIAVRDPNNPDIIVVMLTLKGNNTSAVLRSALGPRFDWGSGRYQMVFDVNGNLDVLIAQDLPHELSLDLFTASGARVNFGKPGYYSVTASATQASVVNFEGEAVLIPQGERRGWPVSAGSASALYIGDAAATPLPMPVELLENNTLKMDVALGDKNHPTPVVAPTAWGCGHKNFLDNAPTGRFFGFLQDGRDVLQLVRGEDATSHGETFCQQGRQRGSTWQDISEDHYLALHTTFLIEDQSTTTLSACGKDATECPLMIIIDYIDQEYLNRVDANVEGVQSPQLVFGFYAAFDPSRTNSLRCAACHQDHIYIQKGAWYTYDSGNLFDLFEQEGKRPLAISQVRFYASGHEYDVRISGISLVSGDTPPSQAVTALGSE